MANRSYLYSIEKEKLSKGLSECNYFIPLAFEILVSADTKMVKSKLFDSDENICLQGNLKEGVQKLNKFIDELYKTRIINIPKLQDQINQTKNFFNTLDGEFIYLDACEVYAMDVDESEFLQKNRKEFENIKNIDKEISKYLISLEKSLDEYFSLKNKLPYKGLFAKIRNKKTEENLNIIENQISNLLCFDYWGQPLYYDVD